MKKRQIQGQKDYESNTIQQTCGFPEPTFPNEGKAIDAINKGIDYFWGKRSQRAPSEQFNHYDEAQKEMEPELEASI